MKRIRCILSVTKKDLTLLLRYPNWVIQLLVWPLIFPLLYILSAYGMSGPDRSGLKAFEAATGTGNYAGFIMIGTMAWMWVNSTMWGFGTYLREEQTRGTLESNWLCPINKFDLMIGGALVFLVQGLVEIIVSLVEYRVIYEVHFTGQLYDWVIIFIIMIPSIYGLGLLFASLILWFKEANAAVNFARGLMMILCGITFPIAVMPGWLQTVAKFLPFTFGIQAAREIMVNGKSLGYASYNLIMCLAEGAVFVLLGVIAFKRTERLVKNSGSLERF